MSHPEENRVSDLDARDSRRWLIGLGISIAFGLFGVVMALLSYSHAHRASPSVTTPAKAKAEAGRPAPGAEPSRRDRRREERNK